jgi:hypothetical protein
VLAGADGSVADAELDLLAGGLEEGAGERQAVVGMQLRSKVASRR